MQDPHYLYPNVYVFSARLSYYRVALHALPADLQSSSFAATSNSGKVQLHENIL